MIVVLAVVGLLVVGGGVTGLILASRGDKKHDSEYREYAVDDPTAIEISGNTAEIPGDAVTPVGIGSVTMRRDTDGKWKFRFYP